MVKKYLVILLLFLSSCKIKDKECYLRKDNIEVYISIKAKGDIINSINTIEVIDISSYYNDENIELINNQLKDYEYELIDKKLYFYKSIDINDKYRLNKTIIELNKRGFNCG